VTFLQWRIEVALSLRAGIWETRPNLILRNKLTVQGACYHWNLILARKAHIEHGGREEASPAQGGRNAVVPQIYNACSSEHGKTVSMINHSKYLTPGGPIACRWQIRSTVSRPLRHII